MASPSNNQLAENQPPPIPSEEDQSPPSPNPSEENEFRAADAVRAARTIGLDMEAIRGHRPPGDDLLAPAGHVGEVGTAGDLLAPAGHVASSPKRRQLLVVRKTNPTSSPRSHPRLKVCRVIEDAVECDEDRIFVVTIGHLWAETFHDISPPETCDNPQRI